MLERIAADWPVKLLSLVLAFGIWIAITGEERIPVNFQIALDPQLPPEHILSETPPTQITVRLVGPQSVIQRLDPLEMAIRLDLTKTPPGEREVQLTAGHLVGKPPRAEVEFFDPERVQLVVDNRLRRQVSVKANIVGHPPAGYTMYRARVRPDMVLVEGPASQVSKLTEIGTDPVTLDERTRRFMETVSAVPGELHVRLVDPQPLEVRVEIDVTPIQRVYEDLPVSPAAEEHAAVLNPTVADVTLTGPPALLDRIGAQQIRVVADLSELDPSTGQRRVSLSATVDIPTDQQARVSVESIAPLHVLARLSERNENE